MKKRHNECSQREPLLIHLFGTKMSDFTPFKHIPTASQQECEKCFFFIPLWNARGGCEVGHFVLWRGVVFSRTKKVW